MAADWKLPFNIQHDGTLAIIIYILGTLSFLRIISNVAAFFHLYLIRPSKLHRYLHDTDGKPAWALVTGASDGIGKHLCHGLAANGFNVVLHGRNPTKLAAVRDALTREFPGREFRSLIADASVISCNNCRDQDHDHDHDNHMVSSAKNRATTTTPPVDFQGLAASLADINLTVLINNAGGNYPTPPQPVYQFLQDAPEARLVGNVNLNAVFPLLLQSVLLPHLHRARPALVLNVGSLSDAGLPMLASYASSKAFLNTLSRVVPNELGLQGYAAADLEVLAVRVGETTGTSANGHPASLLEPDSAAMARAVLARVGCGRPDVVAYLPHALTLAALGLAPAFVRQKAFLRAIRTRWLEEQERLKKSG